MWLFGFKYHIKMYKLTKELYFPAVETTHSSGIVAFGGDLSTERLILAYKSGIFPWFEDGEEITTAEPGKIDPANDPFLNEAGQVLADFILELQKNEKTRLANF